MTASMFGVRRTVRLKTAYAAGNKINVAAKEAASKRRGDCLWDV
jgi:hypothetical protein